MQLRKDKTVVVTVAGSGIGRAISILPGYILTTLLTKTLDNATLKAIAGLHPLGRLATSDEVAELCLWLNSDKASFVTGACYNADGGYLAQYSVVNS
jgi:NAD(P)-dependent dehydrogenase (short-subunit alcohol dehydrogenase family)